MRPEAIFAPMLAFTFGITEIGRALFLQQQLSFATDAAARELYIAPDTASATLSTQIVDSLFRERDGNLWGSMVKQTLKRKRPNFDEGYHGFRSFNDLLEEAQRLGLLKVEKDAKSGGYLIVGFGPEA